MKQLRTERERFGLTQSQLAEAIGTTQQTVARWEAGKAEPNLAALRDLAVCLNTSVDRLLGRKSTLEDQTINPLAWLLEDKSGYWGNVGIRLPNHQFSIWYPITTFTMEKIFGDLQDVGAERWISFQTLNNKMVICRPVHLQAVTFLNEAEDEVTGDWEVGPSDVQGWPQEIFECLEHLIWNRLDITREREEDSFSEKLIASTEDIIKEFDINEDKMMDMCVRTHVFHTDGTKRSLVCSSEKLANVMYDFDLGIDPFDSKMLHLDDEGGEHSVFLSIDLISLLELPLLALKEGMMRELEDAAGELGPESR